MSGVLSTCGCPTVTKGRIAVRPSEAARLNASWIGLDILAFHNHNLIMLFAAQNAKGTDCTVTSALFMACSNTPGQIDRVTIAAVPNMVPRQKMYMTWFIEK